MGFAEMISSSPKEKYWVLGLCMTLWLTNCNFKIMFNVPPKSGIACLGAAAQMLGTHPSQDTIEEHLAFVLTL